jgi:hypothetical protein
MLGIPTQQVNEFPLSLGAFISRHRQTVNRVDLLGWDSPIHDPVPSLLLALTHLDDTIFPTDPEISGLFAIQDTLRDSFGSLRAFRIFPNVTSGVVLGAEGDFVCFLLQGAIDGRQCHVSVLAGLDAEGHPGFVVDRKFRDKLVGVFCGG